MNKYRIRRKEVEGLKMRKYILEKETPWGWELEDYTFDLETREEVAVATLKENLERRTRNDIVEIFER